MAKTLCKWKKKEIEKDQEALVALVTEPKFICQGCARAANKKQHLCKPKKIQQA